jgi:hypothetical protein
MNCPATRASLSGSMLRDSLTPSTRRRGALLAVHVSSECRF